MVNIKTKNIISYFEEFRISVKDDNFIEKAKY